MARGGWLISHKGLLVGGANPHPFETYAGSSNWFPGFLRRKGGSGFQFNPLVCNSCKRHISNTCHMICSSVFWVFRWLKTRSAKFEQQNKKMFKQKTTWKI